MMSSTQPRIHSLGRTRKSVLPASYCGVLACILLLSGVDLSIVWAAKPPNPTPTRTRTRTPSFTRTVTPSPTVSGTFTETETSTSTMTPTVTATPANTNSPTSTNSPENTKTPTITNTPNPPTNIYVRDGGTGTGSDWENALDDLPAILIRNATYWVADGNYAGYTFNDANSNNQFITIRKATMETHGTEAGWEDSFGDGLARWGGLVFSSDYYVIDGVTGGGPGSWESGFGFAINSGWHNIHFSGPRHDITISHLDIENNGRGTGDSNEHCYYGIDGIHDVTITYCYMHDVNGCQFITRSANRVLLEYTKLARNGGSGPTSHREAWSASDDDNVVIRHCIFEDISNTAIIALVNGAGDADNWRFYGNVFMHTGSMTDCNITNGIISTKYSSPTFIIARNWEFYNNSILNINGVSGLRIVNGSNISVYNNIWYNNTGNTIHNGLSGVTLDYNWYCDNKKIEGCNPPCDLDAQTVAAEPNGQLGSGNPFFNWINENYRLNNSTLPGISLDQEFSQDPFGNMRGADGTWDRGAYEYGLITNPANTPPTVSAGAGQTIRLPSDAILMGIADDDGLPSGILTVQWSTVTGPSMVSFSNESSPSTTASFTAVGNYILCLTATDGLLSVTDEVTITVDPPSPDPSPTITPLSPTETPLPEYTTTPTETLIPTETLAPTETWTPTETRAPTETWIPTETLTPTLSATNQAPIVNAGEDQTVTVSTGAFLSGTAFDDGLPSGLLNVSWSRVSGGGKVTFSDPNSAATQVTFSKSGDFVLRLTGTDGALSSYDEVKVTVNR